MKILTERWPAANRAQVSRFCQAIDECLKAFPGRPIKGDWPYLRRDATAVKVCRNGRIISVAVIIALGVDTDGRREIISLHIAASEAETFWVDVVRTLARRGLPSAVS